MHSQLTIVICLSNTWLHAFGIILSRAKSDSLHEITSTTVEALEDETTGG